MLPGGHALTFRFPERRNPVGVNLKPCSILLVSVLIAWGAQAQAPIAEPPPATERGAAATGLQVERGYAEVDGGRLYYEVAGEGPIVVLIHDGVLYRVSWDEVFEPLSEHYRVIRYDRRGFGLSTAPQKAFSHLDDLHTLLRFLEVQQATLIGSSSGGGLAIDYTLAHPDQVNALVLVGAVVSGLGYTSHFMDRTRANAGPDLTSTIERWAADRYTIAPGNTAVRQRVRDLMLANPQKYHGDEYDRGPDQPALPNLGRIAVPTLILVGEADIPDVHAHAGAIEAGVPSTKRKIIRDAGHLPYLEQPQPFTRDVLYFLSSVCDKERRNPQQHRTRGSSDRRSTGAGRRLAAAPTPERSPATGFATVNGVDLYYEVLGDGPALVLIHGGGINLRMWDDQVQPFAEHFQVIRYDTRGHGRSQSASGPYADHDDLYRLLQHLGIKSAAIMGLSMGGRVAIDFTLEHPDMVSALIPVAPGLSGYQFTWEGIEEDWRRFVEANRKGDVKQSVELFQRCWTDGPKRTPEQVDPAVRERVRVMFHEGMTRIGEQGTLVVPEPPAISRLSQIQAPTLVIVGDLDTPDILRIVNILARKVPGAKKVVIPGAAHVVNMERPDEFNRAVLDFLRKTNDGG